MPDKLTFDQFAKRFCDRQMQTPSGLLDIFHAQQAKYHNVGWFLLECVQMDSTSLGKLTILPYGPENTFKQLPDHPVSPQGLASDMAVAIAYTLADELPAFAAPWTAPPPPRKRKGNHAP